MIDRTHQFPFIVALMLAIGLAGSTRTHAAGVLGAYHDAEAVGKIKIRTDDGDRVRRFSLEDGKVVVARKKIDVHFKDRERGHQYKLKMKLRDRVKRADTQVVHVATGRLYIKDLETGETIARGGGFSPTPFQLLERDGTRVVRNARPLRIARIAGDRPFDGAKIALRVRAFRGR